MAERTKATVLKTVSGATRSWVRIPLLPLKPSMDDSLCAVERPCANACRCSRHRGSRRAGRDRSVCPRRKWVCVRPDPRALRCNALRPPASRARGRSGAPSHGETIPLCSPTMCMARGLPHVGVGDRPAPSRGAIRPVPARPRCKGWSLARAPDRARLIIGGDVEVPHDEERIPRIVAARSTLRGRPAIGAGAGSRSSQPLHRSRRIGSRQDAVDRGCHQAGLIGDGDCRRSSSATSAIDRQNDATHFRPAWPCTATL